MPSRVASKRPMRSSFQPPSSESCTRASNEGRCGGGTPKRRAFVDTPGTSVRNADEGVAERYGHLVKQLREQGTPIPTNDIWIAATALESGARLLTCDSHFTHVAGIMTESP